jgi:hypothetical protein
MEKKEKILKNPKLSKHVLDLLPFPAIIISKERVVIYANKSAKDFEVFEGTHCWDTFGKQLSISEEDKAKFATSKSFPVKGIKCIFCQADKAIDLQEHTIKVEKIGETVFEIHWNPLDNNMFLHYGIDVTENYG